MAHEFESGFFVNTAAWHGLGTVLNAPPSVDEGLRLAGLDWDVLDTPIQAEVLTEDGFTIIPIEGKKALIRSTDKRVLGVVSDKYTTVQNREAFGFFDPLIQDGTIELDTAGSLRSGERIWVLARYREGIEVANGDQVLPYLLLATGHDGKMAIRLKNTAIRVVCHNTLSAAINESKRGFTIAHKGDPLTQLTSVRKFIIEANQQIERTADEWRQLARKGVSLSQVREFARLVFDDEYVKAKTLIEKFKEREEREGREAIKAQTREAIRDLEKILNNPTKRVDEVVDAFGESPGADGRTAWSMLNAATYVIDHGRGSAEGRLNSSWFGKGAERRERATEAALSLI